MTALVGDGRSTQVDHGDPNPDAVVVIAGPNEQAQELEPWRVRVAISAILGLTGLLTIWALERNGYANTYYAAAAQSAATDWRAMFFGALDAPGWITVDKPPLSIWVMGLSVRTFGLGAWSLLLPQALMGVMTVGILFATVRRWCGSGPGLLAALVMALTPVAVLIFRFDDPDALLTLLLVGGAWALSRGIDTGRTRWLVLAGALVGLGFETKFLQAYLVLPAFALVVLVGGTGGIGRRLGQLLIAAISVLIASGWWVAIVEAIPLAERPYIGGSTTGGPLQLLLGYDGLGRIVGEAAGPGGAFGGVGAMFGGAPGILRLLAQPWAGGVGWLLPLATVLGVAGFMVRLVERPAAGRRDPWILGYLLWGGWLTTQVVVLSFMSGIVHSYYAVTLAPAVAALVGMGVVALWRWRRRSALGGLALGVCVVGTVWWATQVLAVAPSFAPWLGPLVLVLGAVGGLLLCLPRSVSVGAGPVAPMGLVLALVAILLGPTAWSVATVGVAQAGGDPVAGPPEASRGGVGGFLRGGLRNAFGTGPFPGADVRQDGLASWLLAHHAGEDWIAAISGAAGAAGLQISSGQPVLAMGGFIGSDPTPTLGQLQELVHTGRLRYVLEQRGPIAGGLFASALGRVRDEWVRSTCLPIRDDQIGGRVDVYDCAGR